MTYRRLIDTLGFTVLNSNISTIDFVTHPDSDEYFIYISILLRVTVSRIDGSDFLIPERL